MQSERRQWQTRMWSVRTESELGSNSWIHRPRFTDAQVSGAVPLPVTPAFYLSSSSAVLKANGDSHWANL